MQKKPEKIYGEYYFAAREVPMAVKRVEGAHLSHQRDYTGTPHTHTFLEIVLVTGGKGTQSINGVEYPVQAGDVFVMQGRTAHWFPDYRELKLINIMFSRSLFASQMEFLHRIPGFNVIFRVTPAVGSARDFRNRLHLSVVALARASEFSEAMERELTQHAAGWEAAATAELLSLIVFLSREYSPDTTDRTAVSRLGHFLARLEAQFARRWTLSEMSREVSMSPNQFLRIFKAATGGTPMKYLNGLRLKCAAHLLSASTLNITQIAEQCGFPDSNYFSKRFSAQYHCAPRQYRARMA